MWASLSTISDGKSPFLLQVQSLVQLYKAKYIMKISSVCNLRHLFQELNNCLQRSADLLYPGAEDLSAGYCVLCGHCGRLLPGCGSGGCQRYAPLKRYSVPNRTHIFERQGTVYTGHPVLWIRNPEIQIRGKN